MTPCENDHNLDNMLPHRDFCFLPDDDYCCYFRLLPLANICLPACFCSALLPSAPECCSAEFLLPCDLLAFCCLL